MKRKTVGPDPRADVMAPVAETVADGTSGPARDVEGVRRDRDDAVVFRGTGVSLAMVTGVVVTLLAIVVAFQNTDHVSVDFLAWHVDSPLVVVILAAGVAGVLFDEVVGFFWRRHRRHSLTDRSELRQLRRRG